MASIGIFWVFEGEVFGVRTPVNQASERIAGVLDSDAEHVSSWPHQQRLNSALTAYEYQDIPRGRVLYQCNIKRYRVYLDKSLMTQPIKKAIADYFGFTVPHADWRCDLHYTTAPDQIGRLLDD